jgi:hypothetical protein
MLTIDECAKSKYTALLGIYDDLEFKTHPVSKCGVQEKKNTNIHIPRI